MTPDIQGIALVCATIVIGMVCDTIKKKITCNRTVRMAALELVWDDNVERWVPVEFKQSDEKDEEAVRA